MKYIIIISALLNTLLSKSQITLSHNIGNDIAVTDIHSCNFQTVNWARTFTLQDFGVAPGEELIINKGRVAINPNWTAWDAHVRFNIYAIDDNFPASFNPANLLGSSQAEDVWMYPGPYLTVFFENPVVVPENVERILVEVQQLNSLNGEVHLFCSGTATDDGDYSWFKAACGPGAGSYVKTIDIGRPNARFYIVANGSTQPAGPRIEYAKNCHDFSIPFSLSNSSDVTAVAWDFGDAASGGQNVSFGTTPSHLYPQAGNYTVTAACTKSDGSTLNVSKIISVSSPPQAFPIADIIACEDTAGSGISSQFNTGNLAQQLLNGQAGKVISYYDASGSQLPSPLPSAWSNTNAYVQTIRARVAQQDNPSCYAETTITFRTKAKPAANPVATIFACDNDNDGIAGFDTTYVMAQLLGTQTGMNVEFYNGANTLLTSLPPIYQNVIPNQETIRARVTDATGGCFAETTFLLKTVLPPALNAVSDIIACDPDNDGFTTFNLSSLEAAVVANPTQYQITYYDSSGATIPQPLSTVYGNIISVNDFIRIVVKDNTSGCESQMSVNLKAMSQPAASPVTLYACNDGNGTGAFDTSGLINAVTGSQAGLKVSFSDPTGVALPSPLPNPFLNSGYPNGIVATVANPLSPDCRVSVPVTFDILPLPEINLNSSYSFCESDHGIMMAADTGADHWQWSDASGSILSSARTAYITEGGSYTLEVLKTSHGITCSSSFTFTVDKIMPPAIETVDTSGNTGDVIKIIAVGTGNYEYSVDGSAYQPDNTFYDVPAGIHTVYVRDRGHCGEDKQLISVLGYPSFFTPNGDGSNDVWQVKGLLLFPDANLRIYDRFGKFLTALTFNQTGWDGTFNGRPALADDYWFTLEINGKEKRRGHFSLFR